jgi:hypothetical protein
MHRLDPGTLKAAGVSSLGSLKAWRAGRVRADHQRAPTQAGSERHPGPAGPCPTGAAAPTRQRSPSPGLAPPVRRTSAGRWWAARRWPRHAPGLRPRPVAAPSHPAAARWHRARRKARRRARPSPPDSWPCGHSQQQHPVSGEGVDGARLQLVHAVLARAHGHHSLCRLRRYWTKVLPAGVDLTWSREAGITQVLLFMFEAVREGHPANVRGSPARCPCRVRSSIVAWKTNRSG